MTNDAAEASPPRTRLRRRVVQQRPRFSGIIVDEAQDCGEVEVALLRRLYCDGLPLTVVYDKNQAIYEWRNATPELLDQLARDVSNRIVLRGNWRSNQRIIDFSSTVQRPRERIVSVSENNHEAGGVLVLPYHKDDTRKVLERFRRWIESCGSELPGVLVLAHQFRHATDVACLDSYATTGKGAVERLARASATYWNTNAEPQAIASSVELASRVLLEMLGVDRQRTVEQMATEVAIDVSWLRRVSVGILKKLPISHSQTVGEWVAACRGVVNDISLPSHVAVVKNLIRSPPGKKDVSIATLAGVGSDKSIVACTIHAAKGSEADAVLVSMPHDGRRSSRTGDLIRAWIDARDGEEKRVLYVGLTRARRFLGLAVPDSDHQDLMSHLASVGVEFSVDTTESVSA